VSGTVKLKLSKMFWILKILLMLTAIWQHLEYLEMITDILLQKEYSEPDSDECAEETVPTKLLLTYSQSQDAVQTSNNSFENNETVDDSTFNALSIIKRNLRDIEVRSMTQVSTQNYISNKQGSN
jgi:hypothetical protein